MGTRLQLQSLLETLAPNVYHQPPASKDMLYPCIVYSRDREDVKFAANVPYSRTKRYQVTVIDRDPDSPIPDKVAALPRCVLNRCFKAGNLNHDVFNLYF